MSDVVGLGTLAMDVLVQVDRLPGVDGFAVVTGRSYLPGGSGTVRLGRLLGRNRALEAVLGCDDIDADTAERWGWVNRTLNADALWPHVERLAARIASFPPHAVAAAKASVLRAEHGVGPDLQAEALGFQGTLAEASTRDAMQRFVDGAGQTPAGEARLGALCAELHAPPPAAG